MAKAFLLFVLMAMMHWEVLAVSKYIGSCTQFTADIYKEMGRTETGNFAVSPISAQIVLSLAYQGATGKTARQLCTALQLPEDRNIVQQMFIELISDLYGSNKNSLSGANKMYLQRGYNVKENFKKIAQDVFQVEIENVDFQEKSTVDVINRWVEKRTHHKIKDLVSRDDFNGDTTSLLINALYFQGTWEYPFLDELTHKGPFYVDSVTQKEVEMMIQDEYFNFHENKQLDAKFLELAFEGINATMTFVLPNQKQGLGTLEQNIEAVLAPQNYHKHRIDLAIPKFQIENTIQFTDILKNLGVHKAFTDAAEFSDILKNKRIKIDKVVQKTFLDVQESGVTAAAATGVYWTEKSMPYASFTANHPFIYFIKVNDIIIFVGRLTSP